MDASVTDPLLIVVEDDDQQQHLHQPKSFKGGWRSSIYIICVEVTERFAYYGLSGNLITYLINVLGESTATAAKNVNIWSGVATVLPLVGALIADSVTGCFKTILISTLIYLTGLVLLVISVSAVPVRYQQLLFFFSLYLVAIGEGGQKPCLEPFGADQFDDDDPEEKKAKSSFFNWWYFGICGGGSVAMLVVFYVQDSVGWTIGFAIPAIGMAIALVIFLLGRRFYRQQVPAGSPLIQVAQVFVAAARKRHLSGCEFGECYEEKRVGAAMEVQLKSRTLTRTDQFRFLDKAMIIDNVDSLSKTRNNWRLCSMTQVEETKLLLRLLPIWMSCLMYGITVAQSSTFFTRQGSTLKRKIGNNFDIPPASLQASVGIVAIIVVPIYDRILVPAARNITGFPSGIKILQRNGIGIFLSIINMVVAALVEARRIRIATDHGLVNQPSAIVPMTILWLLPQYVIMGVVDVFTIIGLQELFYDQMPDGMRSIGSAACLSVVGFGSLLSSVVISIVQWMSSRGGDEWLGDNLNRAHLDYYYWVLAGLSALWLCVYLGIAKHFVYKKVL